MGAQKSPMIALNDANCSARKSAFLPFTHIASLALSALFVLSSVKYNRIITVVMVWSLHSSVSFKDLLMGSTPTGASAILNLAT